jgi:pyruvate carboxylase subunit B
VVGFPMPGGAIGPNVHMMKEAGILDRYSEVLAEFPIVVKAGGAWTSVTPGSQQYWLQAFNNVLLGRWKKMNDGYGKAVLGYFGRPPLPPDPEVVRIAAEQLGMPPFDGDPLEAAPDGLAAAREALEERGLDTKDENVFLVASAIVAGKNMDLNEGIRLLTGKAKIVLPFKEKKVEGEAPSQPKTAGAPSISGPITTTCTVVENGSARNFTITIQPPAGGPAVSTPIDAAAVSSSNGGTPVFSPFQGKTELVEINVNVGDAVTKGQVVAAVEAMKAKHDVKAPCSGKVLTIDADIGADIEAGRSILTIGE